MKCYRHLSDIVSVLRHCARHPLETEFGLKEPNDPHIFRYFER